MVKWESVKAAFFDREWLGFQLTVAVATLFSIGLRLSQVHLELDGTFSDNLEVFHYAHLFCATACGGALIYDLGTRWVAANKHWDAPGAYHIVLVLLGYQLSLSRPAICCISPLLGHVATMLSVGLCYLGAVQSYYNALDEKRAIVENARKYK